MRRSSLTISAAFHVTVFIVAALGLPFWARRAFVVPQPIVVDFVDVSKVTETNKIVPQPVPPREKPDPKQAEAPPPAAKNTASEAVAPVKEKVRPEEKKDLKKPAKSEEVDKDAPPDKTKKAKKEEAEKEPPRDFSSVLKNLADPKDSPAAKDDAAVTPDAASPAPGQNAPLGAKLTMSEEDALRKQLEKCWNVPFGAKDVENMVVEIFMVINRDRTLREARVVNTLRYNTDSFFRAAADSALRAVRSPLCSPFNLPPDKYNTWNTVTVTFNPKDMF